MTNTRRYTSCTGEELLVEARIATEENALTILSEMVRRLEVPPSTGVLDLETTLDDPRQMTLL